ncbi:hypothetical protein [Clostridium saccharobutylicum]|uniref:hypothetical protein n=1 Tax=Clostridium saccharobutylicum TaxID=169679 RepID=UPI001DFE4A33|nr:hypothetical protein [Clostridium saccharobutylicum]NSB95987.1 hypothetical protein [Clostridium saccharobutylicum]
MIIIDIITSILQSIAFGYTINYCIDEEYKVSKVKLCLMILVFSIIGSFLFILMGYNSPISILITHILALCVVVGFYKKNIVCAITAHTIFFLLYKSTLLYFVA